MTDRFWPLGDISRGIEKSANQLSALPTGGRAKGEILAKAGITTQEASRAEKLASVDEAAFESYIAKKLEKQEPVYVRQAITELTGKPM